MISLGLLIAVVAIIFSSTLIRGALGFGNALLAMPLLTLTVGVQAASPVVALLGATISSAVLLRSWRSVDVAAAWRLIVWAALGTPAGVLALQRLPEAHISAALGLLLMAYSLYGLLAPRLPRSEHPAATIIAGICAGVLGGAYNVNGPPIAIYGALRGWDPAQFRATLQCFFLVSGVLILASHAAAGLWTRDVLTLYLIALPPTAAGLLVGGWLGGRISPPLFTRLVYLVLLISGLLLVV